jgi:hypothetical protein
MPIADSSMSIELTGDASRHMSQARERVDAGLAAAQPRPGAKEEAWT